MPPESHSGTYALGHSDRELARLERQGAIFASATEDVLRLAGLEPGMRVLDVGCGAGDVSLIAGGIVGPTGSVIGIDRVDAALATARRRAAAAGLGWLRFATADIDAFDPGEKFDAVIGRFILMHVPQPSAVIRHLAGHLLPGGIIAFMELDIKQTMALPDLPLLDKCLAWITATYESIGADPDMGSHLFGAFRSAGLIAELHGITRIEGGPDAVAYDFAAETIRSLLPYMEQFGVATAEEIGLDTLAERLRRDAVAGNNCIFLPRLVGAWARVPVTAGAPAAR